MPRRKPLQTNFSAGELAPDLSAREDTEQYQNGAKSLLNRRCLIGGGTVRRPGSWREQALPGASRAEEFVVDERTKYVLVFGVERVDAYVVDLETGDTTAAGSVSSTAWTGNIFREMDYEQSGNTAFLTHIDMVPQVLTRTGPSTWTVADIAFATSGPRTNQPYFKVAEATRTLTPSALTGSITLTISGSTAHFVADHVGQVIRYMGRECSITAVAGDGLSCTATVLETLPDTQDLTVTSSADFTVGEVVEGATSGARGVITSIPDATSIFVVVSGAQPLATTKAETTGFDRASRGVGGRSLSGKQTAFTTEDLVGPRGKTAISGVASASPKASVTDWDEQLFGEVFGYPSCVGLHRSRLLFGGHPSIPNALIGSRLGNLFSFDVGDASDADGFFETIGDAASSEIVQIHSAEQLLLLTDKGPYYVPESSANPFRPSSLAFFPFGSPWPITKTAKAQKFDDGVLFVSRSLVIKARPTGDPNRAWLADEVSLISSHMVSNPQKLAVTSNFGEGPERYAIIINDDGTMAVLQLVEAQRIRNMTPWETSGDYTSAAALGEFLYVTTERSIGGGVQYFLERFDQDVTLDLAEEFATQTELNTNVPLIYGATTVNVVVGTQYHLGTWPLEIGGIPDGPYVVGLFYDSEIETLPPSIEDREGSHTGERMRIVEAHVDVQASQRFAANGRELSAYGLHDDLDDPPPVRDGPIRFQFLGWDIAPTVTINQPDPLPLHVRGIKITVAYGR